MSFNCPFCNWETDDFDESDSHYEKHITEYQMEQQEAFGDFSK